MKLTEEHSYIIRKLLAVEHSFIASKLGFIKESYNVIDNDLLNKTIGLLDNLSRIDNERSRKIVVTVSAILWTYKQNSWDGLKDFLILILSRIGFAPSAIMVDENYNAEENSFSGSVSLINELYSTLYQLKHEIQIDHKKILLTGFQKKVWDKLSELNLLGISAPTSAGKSFVILLKAIESIKDFGGNIIYIVPTLSLVAQVCEDFNKQLKIFNIKSYKISTTYNVQEKDDDKIYVLTQEKAISAFSQSENPFSKITVLIVDEIQNIERVANENDQRAKTLYDTLMEFRYSSKPKLTIISGPRVDGLRQLGIDIFNEDMADEEKVKDSPVTSFTYAISKINGRYYFNQYSDIVKEHNRIAITNDAVIEGYGQAQYRDNFLSYLSSFIKSLGSESHNIIFSPTTSQARKTAIKLSEQSTINNSSKTINSLIQYIKDTVHDDYDMCKSIPKGFVYHHGKTPSHVRSVIEYAVKEKFIPNVVCTTTLMQGVNLPAQNVIVRNPDLAIRRRNGAKPKLTDYEIANLRGRAGRLLKDFIGRTYVLEENAFSKDDDQLELFPEAEKALSSGYGDKYNTFKKEIEEDLENNTPSYSLDKEYSFLTTYIRQTVLKYSDQSQQRLLSTGIEISERKINEILVNLENLNVPQEVCFKNRYWDPIDLNTLYEFKGNFNLPMSINDDRIEHLLNDTLLKMKSSFPAYYNRHLDISENLLFSVCISAKDWMREKTLKSILNSPHFDSADRIEERISLLQSKISYGLPMLLKPLYDMVDSENMLLRFIEIGAYKPITRKMIELNIPRETAIYLNTKIFNDNQQQLEHMDDFVINRLREKFETLDKWIKIQIIRVI